MSLRPQAVNCKTSKRFIPLRYRFVTMTTALLILLLGVLALTLGYWQSRSIRERLEDRGLDIAGSLAATSINTLINYNYVALEQLANQAARDAEIAYVIVHDKEGRIAGYSGRPDLQGTLANDAAGQKAVASAIALTQKAPAGADGYPVLDVAVPVVTSPSGAKWGTIRVGLSFAAIYHQIRQLTAIILVIGVLALGFGVLASFWAARQITRPLMRLVDATVEATQGALEQNIDIQTNDEIEILADNFTSMMHEIIRQKRTLEFQLVEIQHLQKYTAKLLTTMNDGLLSFTMDGTVKSINPAASRLLNLSDHQAAADASIWPLIDDQGGLRRYIQDKLDRPGGAPHEEIHLERKQGNQVIIVSSSLLEDESGAPQEVILNLQDITEQKMMEARFRQAERLAALGTLAAGMAHEIRNPLSAIKTFVQLLPRKLSKPGFLEKFNRTVPREINRINLLVEDLLDLAREPRYAFTSTDIAALLRQTVELFEEEFASQGISFQLRCAGVPPEVSADPNQLNKAVQNILRNAIQAMPDGGTLTVEILWDLDRRPDAVAEAGNRGWVSIAIEDTGVGMEAEMIDEIFNPFFTAKDTGTGLGLAITHKVVSEHGGHVDVKSRIGRGSCFTVYLKALSRKA
jgi:two-component system sensor histidine kinase AtoS